MRTLVRIFALTAVAALVILAAAQDALAGGEVRPRSIRPVGDSLCPSGYVPYQMDFCCKDGVCVPMQLGGYRSRRGTGKGYRHRRGTDRGT